MIAYQNSYEQCITLPAAEGLKAGVFCTINNNNEVTEVAANKPFVGYVKNVRNGKACVMVHGVVNTISIDLSSGYMQVAINEYGELTSMTGGTPVLVLYNDVLANECTIML